MALYVPHWQFSVRVHCTTVPPFIPLCEWLRMLGILAALIALVWWAISAWTA